LKKNNKDRREVRKEIVANEIRRYIKTAVEKELWARAAGRCQFDGCNKILYKSSITQERVNISEKAHIYSISEKGPRGRGFLKSEKALNDISNLMLVCHECHKIIDHDKDGKKYSADLLKRWKNKHEQRVRIVTGIVPDKESHVVIYGANIGEERSPLQYNEVVEAMFPNRYPAEEKPVNLSMSCEHEDKDKSYWIIEEENLRKIFEKKIIPRIAENNPAHFSLFALAPQPLLIKLGTLFTDKISVETYQLHREPKTWKWQDHPSNFEYIVKEPCNTNHPPALIVSLSGKISPIRITSVLGKSVSIWEITINTYNNDFLRSQTQLMMFRDRMRKLMISIKEKHGQSVPLSIFPAMPVACAIEFGRIRMPKADMPWIIYDQNNKKGGFIKALEIL
jgi:hypothetical protein